MRQLTFYLETSIFGFYYDEKPENKLRKDAVKTLLKQINENRFRAVVSPTTVKELSDAPSPYKERLCNLIEENSIEIVEIDEDELNTLVSKYMDENIVPPDFEDDVRHVAYATILRVDILVSLNLEHIANEQNIRRFNAVNLIEGYPSIEIRTPEEVIYYGN